jgi:nicotinamide-nucleotide amidase
MKKATIVSIGNELLSGRTVDTNAAYLAAQLLSIGIPVTGVYTVGDDIDLIVHKIRLAGDDGDIIISTGGLGPTDDDVTRQAVAKFLGVELVLRNELMNQISGYFTAHNLQMPAKNIIQAYIPAGAEAIENQCGTAPGIMARSNGTLYIAMPGVPTEMKEMFIHITPQLREFAGGQAVISKTLKCFGAGESVIAGMLGDMMQRGRNPLINCTVENGVVTLYVIASHKDSETAEQMAQTDVQFLKNKLGDIIYGHDRQTLAEVIGEKLTHLGKTVATAESCTGGLIAKLITDISGSSKYFLQGWVTYSNKAKSAQLGVPAELIEKYGAVSEQVASAMAKGARDMAGADYAIGITGIAGPTGGTEEKPTGLVYISIACDKFIKTERFVFRSDRAAVRIRAAQTALNMLRKAL